MDEATLMRAAARFKAAAEAYAEAVVEMENRELDVKLAIRAGYPAAASEKARDEYRHETWAPAYRARQDAAKALCQAIGVDTSALKYSL